MRKWLLGLVAMAFMALPVLAQDEPVTNLNPSGAIVSSLPALPPAPMDPGDTVCGDLAYDRVNGLAAARRTDGTLDSWVMVHCEFSVPTEIQAFEWITVDNTANDWNGFDDVAIWNAATVESGQATGVGDVLNQPNLSNTRVDGEPLFGRPGFKYTLDITDVCLPAGSYYFGVRIVIGTPAAGQSFILTVPCNGQKPIYFQSTSFGFPLAVPGRNVFGVDYCAAVNVIGKDCDGGDKFCEADCTKVKAKRCDVCPQGVQKSNTPCQTDPECRRGAKGKVKVVACPDGLGGKCKYKKCKLNGICDP
jgi:hypothetical protein